MSSLEEIVHNGASTLGRWVSSNKIQSNTGAGSVGDGQRMEQSSRCLMCHTLSTSGTSSNITLGTLLHARPPKLSLEQGQGAIGSRTADEHGVCSHCRTQEWTESGTNNRLSGPVRGSGC